MKILVIGSGGREHALVYKIAQSPEVDKIFCTPGNAGIAQLAKCVDIKADDISGLINFVKTEMIDFTIVGPEQPLALGIVDQFKLFDLKIFGPNKQAARFESSKVFAKEFMVKYDIPTAAFEVFEDFFEARNYAARKTMPLVIKADGLAQGKGVVVVQSIDEADRALEEIMQKKIFGDAGNKVIIEECLVGEEASILVFTDRVRILPLASSQDHKRVFDCDLGPNTGGMGAYSPAPIVTNKLYNEFLETIIYPLIDGMYLERIDYRGVLYVGIMVTKQGLKVLEFNVRFGDPEAQAILRRLDSDLLEVLIATAEGQLSKYLNRTQLSWSKDYSVCVVCSSGGYPGHYEKGKEISGFEEAASIPGIEVFHSGTKKVIEDGKSCVVTDGGRVLGITGTGSNLTDAIDKTYKAVEKIHFEGMHYRKDIGEKGKQVSDTRRT